MMVGGVAHDFHNMLTAIIGNAELVLGNRELDQAVAEQVREIDSAARKATSLTAQLLSFARQQGARPQVVDLNATIEDMGSIMGRLVGEDVRIRLDLASELPAVDVDAAELEQVLLNLALNGRDAMRPHGGLLTFETRSSRVAPGARPSVTLRLYDTGSGMESGMTERIFEPFFTTKDPGAGTGLGLATVKRIVSGWGGSVSVESAPGEGAVFTVVLPGSRRKVPPPSPRSARDAFRGTETVLIVEDDNSVLDAVSRGLAELGYEVLTAAGASEALQIVEHRSRSVHLVVSDVLMPETSGPEMMKSVRTALPDVRTLYVSGYPGRLVGSDVGKPGIGFLPKPFGPIELAQKIRLLLDGAGPSGTDDPGIADAVDRSLIH